MSGIGIHSLVTYTDDFTVSVIVSAWRGDFVGGLFVAMLIAGVLRIAVAGEEGPKWLKRSLSAILIGIPVFYIAHGIAGYNLSSPHVEATDHTSHWRMFYEIPGIEGVHLKDESAFNFHDCYAEKHWSTRIGKSTHSYNKHSSMLYWTDSQGRSHGSYVTAEKTERHGKKVFGGTLYECTIHLREM